MKHSFNVEIAKDIGINAAIIFEHLAFWIAQNEAAGRNHKDGAFWTYGTQKDIAAQFEYLSLKQTRTALERLTAGGYIKTGRFNRCGYDRTAWYGLTEKGAAYSPKSRVIMPKKAHRKAQTGAPIPITKTNIKPNNNTSLKARADELKRLIGQG